MDRFEYRGGELFCEQVDVARIAEQVGTPLFIYSLNTARDHFYKIRDAFAPFDPLICYSVKANSLGALLAALGSEGGGADIVSGGELFRARRAGIPADRIVYSGVGKTDAELDHALKEDILMFNLESEQEAEVLNDLAGARGTKARVAVRVNPDVDAGTHEYITTGLEDNKFGVPFNDALAFYRRLAQYPHLEVVGVDCHIGSQILSPDPYVEAVGLLRSLVEDIRSAGISIGYLNIGGGFGITYDTEAPATAREHESALGPLVKDLGVKLITEPGRFIAGNAGILVTKVLFRKEGRAKTFVVVDAGMNDLIRPALYSAHHRVEPVAPAGHGEEVVDVVGPICESGDFFTKNRPMEKVERGELVAIFSTGAYGFTMSSQYNSRPRAAEVVVDGDSFEVARKRETYEDLVASESVPK